MFQDLRNDYGITNVINYLRRSRQDVQREKLTGEDTLASQTKLMANVLDQHGLPYVQRMEIGSGDKISTRPIFQEVLEELKSGKYDAIAVKEISRLGRGSYADMGTIHDVLKDYDIYIITPHRIYDLKNSADNRQFRFETFMSREEFETTRERLVGARYNAALEGKWMGNVPFGYSRNEKTLRLEPIEEEAKIIRLIYDLYINGYKGKVVKEKIIKNILEEHQIKTAKNCKYWDTTQIKRILTNDAYIGISKFRTTKRNSNGKVEPRPESEHIIVEDAHEAIISPEDFHKVEELMKQTKPKTRLEAQIYELTGLLTCKVCGKKAVMNRYKRKRLSGDYFDIYVKCNNGCFGVKYDAAANSIINLLKYLKDADQNIIYSLYERTVSQELKNSNQQETLKETMKESLEKRRNALEERLEFIMEKHFEKVYSDAMFKKFEAKILEELEEIKTLEENDAELESASTEETDPLNYEEIQGNFVKIIDAYNSNATTEEKNELLRNIFCSVKIEVIEKGTKKQDAKMEFEISLKHKFWEGNF